MAHAFTESPAFGRALTIAVSIAFWGALLWGVSQLKIEMPTILTGPERETIVLERLPPVTLPKPSRPIDRPREQPKSDEVTDVQQDPPPVDLGPTQPSEEIGDAPLPVISNPTWIRKPSVDDMMGLYPYGALERGLSGRVVLDCVVAANGRIACAVVSETPAGKGFAQAALKASRLFQIAPSMVDGRPTEGGRIRVPISFQAPRD